MSALDHPTMLTKLIIAGEMALQLRVDHGAAARRSDLLEAVATEYAKPADGIRVIGTDTVIYATAVDAATDALMGHQRDGAAKYLRVIGVLLPEIRAALATAIEQRKRPTP